MREAWWAIGTLIVLGLLRLTSRRRGRYVLDPSKAVVNADGELAPRRKRRMK